MNIISCPNCGAGLETKASGPAQSTSLFLVDKIGVSLELVKFSPGAFLAQISSFVGMIMNSLPEERLAECLRDIQQQGNGTDEPLMRASMLSIVNFVKAEVAHARAIAQESGVAE